MFATPKLLRYGAGLLVLVLGITVIISLLHRDESMRLPERQFRLTDLLSANDTMEFQHAEKGAKISLPAALGLHPEYRTEWWYYTGNLTSVSGRRFGYELTFFRSGLSPGFIKASGSNWRTNQIYMAHFAVTDVENRQFHYAERFSRGAAGLAGAENTPFKVWLENWSVKEIATPSEFNIPNTHLTAENDKLSIALDLIPEKPPVLHGESGYSRKGADPDNASFYFSVTRLNTRGMLKIGEKGFEVHGSSWLDREWGTSALGPEMEGWDWFALQLDNGRDLMYYRIRKNDGSASRYSAGSLVDSTGHTTQFQREEIELKILDRWRNPDGVTYPSRWRMVIPDEQISLTITPLVADQELQTLIPYWEGAVSISGTDSGRPVSGRGYVELTGYGGEPLTLNLPGKD